MNHFPLAASPVSRRSSKRSGKKRRKLPSLLTAVTDYRSIAINDSVEADRDIQAIVESYKNVVN
jgi:hypothetical protein